jgi:RNA polymerase sigma-70 factor (ECF subfamily)
MGQVSDADVMTVSRERPAAFAQIYDRHAETLLRYLVRRVGPGDGEGLLGELFQIAFERRASFDPAHESARPWLYGIASNLVLKHRRSEARRLRATARVASESPLTDQNPGESTEIDAVDARALLPRVADAIAALPDGERDALLLFAWEDLSYDEIAAALTIPVGTVRSRLNRARSRLRELIPQEGKPGAEANPRASGRDRP